MHDDLLSIGALARAGGPPVSALRFYDAAGVLRPAHVDPATGYRWYTSAQVHTARLIASLRQAGLPVVDLVAVLETPHAAADVLARHRRRLEEDLTAAHAHLDAAVDILAQPGRCWVAAEDLLGAIAAVRHAVGADAAWPGLAGVLLHLDGATLRLVACDRSRVAVATVPTRQPSGPQVRVVAPLAFLDRIASAALPHDGQVVLGAHRLEILGVHGQPLEAGFPDYQQLLRWGGSVSVTIASGELVASAEAADDIVVVRLDGGRVDLAPPGAGDAFAFSRTFLLDAVRAAAAEHVALALDERYALSVAPADRPDDIGLMMPIRLLH
ncbi:DNA polymerase III subunit beta family protein [Cellulomonas fengjieae]|uniref:MerR family transcriptional regulator n=1 Tax=Cellulomonas fengjieae TaxID=2819978 RepID=A0ABS3SBJ2_9CELL|nr:MerR family transcriptional regulator [Cellulomonas fengjieae]MBO3083012.1 MerR family transcriptional regulator [Cellulomonas fengjieae]QVI65617.1 MerR family transcriptional regulator [Cellulomonas fengjieae]